MTLPRLLVVLMAWPAVAVAEDERGREGLEAAASGGTWRAIGSHGDSPQGGAGASRIDGVDVDVRVYGGWRKLWGGDVNEAVENTTQWTVTRLARRLVTLQDGDAPTMRRGHEYGADVILRLTPRFGVVGGVGWIESSNAGRQIETPRIWAPYPSRSSASLELRAVPVRFGVQYAHPLGRRLGLSVEGGAGLYFTRVQWAARTDVDSIVPTWSEVLSDVRAYDLGFHGGVSLDVGLSDRMGLVIGVEGVHANVGGLGGVRTERHRELDSWGRVVGRSVRREGTLGVFELEIAPEISPLLGLVEDEALWVDELDPIIRRAREASAGLGGLRYTGGLRFGLQGTGGSSRKDEPRADAAGSRVDARVYGGGRLLWGGDVNEAVANTMQFTVSQLYEGLVPLQDGDAPAMRRGREYGADVIVNLTPRFGLVGGVGRIESSSAGGLIETPSSTALYPSRSSAKLELHSVAVRFGGEYAYPLSRRLSVVMEGGAGLYFTRLQWSQRVEVDFIGSTTSDTVSDVRGYDLGFHGGVSFEVSLSERLGLLIGVRGVHANIGGLEGSREGTFTGFSYREGRTVTRSRTEDGTLGILEFSDSPIGGLLGFVEDEALWVEEYGPIVRGVREATAGLGGLRYSGGLRVSF